MNKRIFRKIRVIGDVIMCVDIACHTIRILKNDVCPWVCKKIHKNKNAGATKDDGAPTTTTESTDVNVNEQQ